LLAFVELKYKALTISFATFAVKINPHSSIRGINNESSVSIYSLFALADFADYADFFFEYKI